MSGQMTDPICPIGELPWPWRRLRLAVGLGVAYPSCPVEHRLCEGSEPAAFTGVRAADRRASAMVHIGLNRYRTLKSYRGSSANSSGISWDYQGLGEIPPSPTHNPTHESIPGVGGRCRASGDLVFQSISDGSLRPLKSNASALRALARVKIEMTF